MDIGKLVCDLSERERESKWEAINTLKQKRLIRSDQEDGGPAGCLRRWDHIDDNGGGGFAAVSSVGDGTSATAFCFATPLLPGGVGGCLHIAVFGLSWLTCMHDISYYNFSSDHIRF